MGNIGASRQRYEVLPVPATDPAELDRDLLDRVVAERTDEVGAERRIRAGRG